MLSKPWYVSTEKWEANEPNTIPGVTVLPHFEQRLARIVHTAETEPQAQQRLILELVREVHSLRRVLVWMLVLVPTVLVTVMIVLTVISTHPSPTPPTPATAPAYDY
jgi:hypothetical protein